MRVAKTRFAAYRNGRNAAMRKTRPRRTIRAPKVCAFQVKNATGCTVVRSSRLPSTRQYTRPKEPASPELCLDESKFVVNRNCRVSDEAPVSPKITIVNNYVQRTKLRLHSGGPSSTTGEKMP